MASTFYGLDIATRGLFVAQRQIDLTGHNIANANTEGYTRQRFVTTAIDPIGAKSMWSVSGSVGGGVKTLSIDQIRDRFIDKQYRNELTRASYWDTKYDSLYFIEDMFSNYDAVGLNDIMSGFFNNIQELSKNTTDSAVRTQVVEKAKSMIEMFHAYYDKLKTSMYEQDDMIVAQVKQINTISKQISELNQAILKYELSGDNANDLRDKRNLLLDQLSAMADISYQEVGSGKTDINGKELTTLVVKIGGETLVDHNTYRALVAQRDQTNDITDLYATQPVPTEDLLHSIRFADDLSQVNITGGSIGAYLDMRDGNTVDNQGIPYFKAQLDKLVKALVEEFNAVHKTGWTMPYTDANSVYHDSRTGVSFFDPAGLTIDTFALSEDILESVFNLAAAGMPMIMEDDGHFDTGNNEVALALVKLLQRSDIAVIGGFEKYFNNFITELGSEGEHTKSMVVLEYALLDGLGAQRLSVSGVSADEEMTNLLRFQYAYNAAARVITTMDEALDVLINRTGRVGL